MAQVASQYLNTLLEYQYSDALHLHDPTNAQYYFSDPLALLNWLSSQPDTALRLAKHPRLVSDLVEKLLDPDVEKKMIACERRWGGTFEADLGLLLQFLSTLLLRSESIDDSVIPRIQELLPILRGWQRKYRDKYIGKVSERLGDQIEKPDPATASLVKAGQNDYLVCGYILCGNKKDMNACASCRIQRYCNVDHQKADWKNHKKICNKGLVDLA